MSIIVFMCRSNLEISTLCKIEISYNPILRSNRERGYNLKEGKIIMSKKELDRLKIIHLVLEKRITQKEAADRLSLSYRQVFNIVQKVKQNGDIALIHKNRGAPSNRKYPDELREKAIDIIREKYWDFGPTLANEKLEERDSIKLSRETLRQWMIKAGIWKPKKRRRKENTHTWRKRKDHFGEMIQTDGSEEYWFEGRGDKAILMAYRDDATNTVFARFYPSENTPAAMDSFRRYIEEYGIPKSIYSDKNSIYKTTRKADIDEQLEGETPKTQFGKVIEILDVKLILAHSPQAKGRIENLFSTFQDRVAKEMRLANISNIEEANKFLEKYLPIYNKRFSFPPANLDNYHREVPQDMDLNWVFVFKEKRKVSKDLTVRWRNRLFVLDKNQTFIRERRVTVLENLKSEIRIQAGENQLKFKEVTENDLSTIKKRKTADFDISKLPKKQWGSSKEYPWKTQK